MYEYAKIIYMMESFLSGHKNETEKKASNDVG